MVSTVIFDLDGLLADTERLHRQAYQEVLGRHGVTLTDAEYDEHWILRGRGIGDLIAGRGLDLEPDVLRAEKARRYNDLVAAQAQPMPGALELLRRLRGRKRLALATSSYRDAAEAVLAALVIADFFELVGTGNDVARVKPDPALFLFVAARMGVAPADCVVLEDSGKGIVAARAAGMRCIAVPNEHTRDHDFSQADQVVASLGCVTLSLLDALGGFVGPCIRRPSLL